MKFSVNEKCIGCGLCAASCPDIFTMTDEGVASAVTGDVMPSLEPDASEAAESCPVDAIESSDA